MEEKEGFRVGPKPIFINIFVNKRDYGRFAQKGNQGLQRGLQRGKTLPKNNGILAKLEYLRKNFNFGLYSWVPNINLSC